MKTEPCAKRIRAHLGGRVVVDTVRAKLVWEVPHYPAYYLPANDVRVSELAAGTYRTAPIENEEHVRIEWKAMDAWFEEEEEVFVHPHDPYKRIDILHASRHVEISVNGVALADSRHPTIVYETGAPVRYYVPKSDVRMELLVPTDKKTGCAYKGFARYWRHGDVELAWSYATPLQEAVKIAGLVAFYDEHVDMTIDGKRLLRPPLRGDL